MPIWTYAVQLAIFCNRMILTRINWSQLLLISDRYQSNQIWCQPNELACIVDYIFAWISCIESTGALSVNQSTESTESNWIEPNSIEPNQPNQSLSQRISTNATWKSLIRIDRINRISRMQPKSTNQHIILASYRISTEYNTSQYRLNTNEPQLIRYYILHGYHGANQLDALNTTKWYTIESIKSIAHADLALRNQELTTQPNQPIIRINWSPSNLLIQIESINRTNWIN